MRTDRARAVEPSVPGGRQATSGHHRVQVNMDSKAHWEHVYGAKPSASMSWFQQQPARSLELILEAGGARDSAIIDVGGGDSTLVDALLDRGFSRVTVLDISGAALARAQERLGARATGVTWLEADITSANLSRHGYEIWHDRAAFHFLLRAEDRRRYVDAVRHALAPGGTLVIATFAADGPTRCSALDVARYSPETLHAELGADFELLHAFGDSHRTPANVEQRFTFAAFRHSPSTRD